MSYNDPFTPRPVMSGFAASEEGASIAMNLAVERLNHQGVQVTRKLMYWPYQSRAKRWSWEVEAVE